MADTTYQAKVYKKAGGDELVIASGGTLTMESGSSAVLLGPVVRDLTEVVAATNVLTAAESGKVCFLNHATEFQTTLPAPAAGLKFTFVITAAPSGANYTVITAGTTQKVMMGHVFCAADAASDTSTGGTTLTFVGAQSVVGDRADFVCDGTNWYVVAFCAVAAGITITGE